MQQGPGALPGPLDSRTCPPMLALMEGEKIISLDQWFLNQEGFENTDCWSSPRTSDLLGWERRPIICISNPFPGDANAVGLGAPL